MESSTSRQMLMSSPSSNVVLEYQHLDTYRIEAPEDFDGYESEARFYIGDTEDTCSSQLSNSIALTAPNSDIFKSSSSLGVRADSALPSEFDKDEVEIDMKLNEELATIFNRAGDRLSGFFANQSAVDGQTLNNKSRLVTRESEVQIILDQDDNDSGCGTGADPHGFSPIHSPVRVFCIMIFTVFGAIMVSSGGNFFAGIILDHYQKWSVFQYVPELYYLIPTLLGLKGNLEMTMVARLSTFANMGGFNSWRRVVKTTVVNISLVQCQAIVVSLLASLVAFLASLFLSGQGPLEMTSFNTDQVLSNGTVGIEAGVSSGYITTKILVLFSTSLATANIACFGCSMIMIGIIVLCSKLNMNPDNFATAVAASFGDVVTSFLLCIISEFIYKQTVYLPGVHALPEGARFFEDLRSPLYALGVIFFFGMLSPLMLWLACKSKSTRQVLLGIGAWTPILLAMAISFFAGLILRAGAASFMFMTLFQPLINGVGGNLAAITTSRMATDLHMGSLHVAKDSLYSMLKQTFTSFFEFSKENMQMVLFVLMSIAVHLTYGNLLPMFHGNDQDLLSGTFYLFYILAASVQVLVLLMLTRLVVNMVWWLHCDPDTCAIPILTAMGDMMGTLLLYSVFFWMKTLKDSSATPPDTTAAEDTLMLNASNIVTQSAQFLFVAYTNATTAAPL